MPKKAISSVELAALVSELQFLAKGKISQIYHAGKELLFQLHAPGKGKQLLRIIPGKWLCLTKRKETLLKPSSFCMQLRKYLDNAVINQIYQKYSERVVVFEVEKKEKYLMIVELFSKGNLVLTNDKYQIITAWERQAWKDRTIAPGEKYLFPSQGVNWKTISGKELENILHRSEKKNLATSLAMEIGLGGVSAEEVCKKAGADKNSLPREGNAKEILRAIRMIAGLAEKPAGFIYDEEITPFPLEGQRAAGKTASFNEAIDTLNPFPKPSPYGQEIKAVERMIREQEESLGNLQQRVEMNKKKGELIYENYTPLQRLLAIVAEMRKTKSWGEIADELKKERKIKKVDLKEKKLVIDL